MSAEYRPQRLTLLYPVQKNQTSIGIFRLDWDISGPECPEGRSAAAPIHRAGREHVAAELAAEDSLRRTGALDEALEVDAGVVAHLVEH